MAKRVEIKLVGYIGVDAGLCWIGDPCYILKDSIEARYKSLGKNWAEFCANLPSNGPVLKSFKYDAGHEGLGVCVSTGFGDGTYPVYAKIVHYKNHGPRVMKIWIEFK